MVSAYLIFAWEGLPALLLDTPGQIAAQAQLSQRCCTMLSYQFSHARGGYLLGQVSTISGQRKSVRQVEFAHEDD
jgi:hypothetical protein